MNDLHDSLIDKLIINFKSITAGTGLLVTLFLGALMAAGVFSIPIPSLLAAYCVGIPTLVVQGVALVGLTAVGTSIAIGIFTLAATFIPALNLRVTEAKLRHAVHTADIQLLFQWVTVATQQTHPQSLAWTLQFSDGTNLVDYIIHTSKKLSFQQVHAKKPWWGSISHDKIHRAQTQTRWLDSLYQREIHHQPEAEQQLYTDQDRSLSYIQALFQWCATQFRPAHGSAMLPPKELAAKLRAGYWQVKYAKIDSGVQQKILREPTPNEIIARRWSGVSHTIQYPVEDHSASKQTSLPPQWQQLLATPSMDLELNQQHQVESSYLQTSQHEQQSSTDLNITTSVDVSQTVTVSSLLESQLSHKISSIDYKANIDYSIVRPDLVKYQHCARRWGDQSKGNIKKWLTTLQQELAQSHQQQTFSVSNDAFSRLNDYGGNLTVFNSITHNLPLGFYLVEEDESIILKFSEDRRLEQRSLAPVSDNDIIAAGRSAAALLTISWSDDTSQHKTPEQLVFAIIHDLGVYDEKSGIKSQGQNFSSKAAGLLEPQHISVLKKLSMSDRNALFSQYQASNGTCHFEIGLNGKVKVKQTTKLIRSIDELVAYFESINKPISESNIEFLQSLRTAKFLTSDILVGRPAIYLSFVRNLADKFNPHEINQFIQLTADLKQHVPALFASILKIVREENHDSTSSQGLVEHFATSHTVRINDLAKINDLVAFLTHTSADVHELFKFFVNSEEKLFEIKDFNRTLSLQEIANVFPVVLALAKQKNADLVELIDEFKTNIETQGGTLSKWPRERYAQLREFLSPTQTVSFLDATEPATHLTQGVQKSLHTQHPVTSGTEVKLPKPYEQADLIRLLRQIEVNPIQSNQLHHAMKRLNEYHYQYLSQYKNLTAFTPHLAEAKARHQAEPTDDRLIESLAIIRHAIFLMSGGRKWLRLEQVVAILLNTNETIANQIETSEGKTTIIQVIALLRVLKGQKVNIYTHAEAYAIEDFDAGFSRLAERMGITVSSRYKQSDASDNPIDDDVHYIDITTAAMEAKHADISGQERRHADFGLVDEVDNPLFDVDSTTSLRIPGEPVPIDTARREFFIALNQAIEAAAKQVPDDLKHAIDIALATDPYYDSLSTQDQVRWIQSAVTALTLREKQHYVVNQDGERTVVDIMHPETTGRQDTRSCWSNGIHQLVAARESLKHKDMEIPPLSTVIADSDVINYLRQEYSNDGGALRVNLFSGTLGDDALLDYIKTNTQIDQIIKMPRAKRDFPSRDPKQYDAQTYYDLFLLEPDTEFDDFEGSSIHRAVVMGQDGTCRIVHDGEWLELPGGEIYCTQLTLDADDEFAPERVTPRGHVRWDETLPHDEGHNARLNDIIDTVVSGYQPNGVPDGAWPRVVATELVLPSPEYLALGETDGHEQEVVSERYNRRYDFTPIFCADKDAHFARALDVIAKAQQQQYASILFFSTVEQCEEFYRFLRLNGVRNVQVFDDTVVDQQDIIKPSEDDMKMMASTPGSVTITTAAGGRATDFANIELGIEMMPTNGRVHDQAIGRVGRNGKLAIAMTILNVQDLGVDELGLSQLMPECDDYSTSCQHAYRFWQQQRSQHTLAQLEAKKALNRFKADITAEYIERKASVDDLTAPWTEFYGTIDRLWDHTTMDITKQTAVLDKWQACFADTSWQQLDMLTSSMACAIG